MAVGALDAYLCDAFVDCFTSVLKAYAAGKWQGDLPAAYANEKLPAGVVLDNSRQDRPRWALRMAARSIMERDNMLSLSRIPEKINGILPARQKLWVNLAEKLTYIGSKRFTKWTHTELDKMHGQARANATKQIIAQVNRRIGDTIQIRHDWAHNCGRPKTAILRMTYGQARSRLIEIGWFVFILNSHIDGNRRV
jgi:hypothetical protein